MTPAVREIALAAATRIAGSAAEATLPADVEAELAHEEGTPRAYADPVSIASLIVAIVSLAWNIYSQLRRSPQELAGEVRAQWAQDHGMDEQASTVIDVVAEETVKYSER
jgi:hypothetical protein